MARRPNKLIGRRFAAVDCDSRQLRIVEAERVGRNIRIGRTAVVEFPEDLDPGDAGQLGPFLGRTLKKMKLSKAPLLMTVHRAEAVLKPLTLPPGTDADEMAGMVQFQMQSELPYRLEEAVVDFTVQTHYDAAPPSGHGQAGIDVLVAAVKLPVVDHYRQVANLAGARLVRLGLGPYADRRCIEACVQRDGEDVLAVVHLTADAAEINVLDGGSLAFTRSAVIDLPDPDQSDQDARDQAVNAVTLEAARSLRSYIALEGGKRVNRLIVAGSTGIESDLVEALGQRIGVTGEQLDPTERLRLRESDSPQQASGLITALGLAISSAGQAMPFDFLNPRRPRVQRDNKRTAVLAGLAGLVLLIAGLWLVPQKLLLQPLGERILRHQARLAREKDKAEALKADRARLSGFDDWLYRRGAPLVHSQHISALLPGPEELVLRDLKFGDRELEIGGKRRWRATVSFRAKAPSKTVLYGLRDRLEQAGYSVEFQAVTTDPRDPHYGYYVDVTVFYSPQMEVDLAAVSPEPRPADEIPLGERGYAK